MNDALRHRGVDGEGYMLVHQHDGSFAKRSGPDSPAEIRNVYPQISSAKIDFPANIGLARRRFSIIDLMVGGHQLFFDSSNQCCVVYN
jgi:asparagine synthetase B (glutamine-hydrolysing)